MDFRGRIVSGIDVDECAEGSDHQPGADQQDEREAYLDHDQSVTGAMALAALAGCPAPAQTRSRQRAGIS